MNRIAHDADADRLHVPAGGEDGGRAKTSEPRRAGSRSSDDDDEDAVRSSRRRRAATSALLVALTAAAAALGASVLASGGEARGEGRLSHPGAAAASAEAGGTDHEEGGEGAAVVVSPQSSHEEAIAPAPPEDPTAPKGRLATGDIGLDDGGVLLAYGNVVCEDETSCDDARRRLGVPHYYRGDFSPYYGCMVKGDVAFFGRGAGSRKQLTTHSDGEYVRSERTLTRQFFSFEVRVFRLGERPFVSVLTRMLSLF